MYVVTFYSYKGGVGRTMALVNTAVELATNGRKVLIVDFDLEAPGISTYSPFTSLTMSPGIVRIRQRVRQNRCRPPPPPITFKSAKLIRAAFGCYPPAHETWVTLLYYIQ